jgi:hypothetical protein
LCGQYRDFVVGMSLEPLQGLHGHAITLDIDFGESTRGTGVASRSFMVKYS